MRTQSVHKCRSGHFPGTFPASTRVKSIRVNPSGNKAGKISRGLTVKIQVPGNVAKMFPLV